MKRNWLILAIILLIGFILNSCGGDDITHIHNFCNWITITETNCITAEVQERICTCGEKETQIVGMALGHDFEIFKWVVKSIGVKSKICGRNGCNETNGDLDFLYNIGDIGTGGGIIFYRSETGFLMTDDNSIAYYLEAAPTDMPTMLEYATTEPRSPAFDTEGTGTAIGTGRNNTNIILLADENAPAAKATKNCTDGGQTDWFLPSKDELNEIYKQMNIFNNLGITNYESGNGYFSWYISSSISNMPMPDGSRRINNWIQVLDNHDYHGGKQYDIYYGGKRSVRAIRAF